MFFKTVFALSVIIALVQSGPVDIAPSDPENLVNIIMLEEACVRQGGMCLRIEDCSPDNLVHLRGVLCPRQRHLGVECCYMSMDGGNHLMS